MGARSRTAAVLSALALGAAAGTGVPVSAQAGVLPSTTTVAASPSTSFVGSTVTLTSTVRFLGLPGLGITPTGTVTFRYDGGTTHTVLGTRTLPSCLLTTCTVTLATSSLPVGAGTITATYSGDTLLAASSATTGVTRNYLPEPTPTSADTETCPSGVTCETQSVTATQGGSTDTLTVTGGPSAGSQTVTASLTVGATLDCPLPAGDHPRNSAMATFDSTSTTATKSALYRVEGPEAVNISDNYGNHTSFLGCFAAPYPFNGYSSTGSYGPAPAYNTPYGVYYQAYLNSCVNNSGARPCFQFLDGSALPNPYVEITVNTDPGDPKFIP